MAVYSIRDLEKLCGIKAHTIRIWEQRYGIIKPNRTDTNIRYYHDADLNLLLNIVILNRNGLKISKIAKMSKEEIAEKVSAISEVHFDLSAQLDELTLAMVEMDEYKFDLILSTNIQQLGFEKTMIEVVYPFLDKLSVFWLTGSISPIQENFITNLIRQKLITAIDKEPVPKKTANQEIFHLFARRRKPGIKPAFYALPAQVERTQRHLSGTKYSASGLVRRLSDPKTRLHFHDDHRILCNTPCSKNMWTNCLRLSTNVKFCFPVTRWFPRTCSRKGISKF